MYAEEDLLALSGLQHLVFCARQWGLIHLEDVWAENRLTAEGRILHERADRTEVEVRGELRIVRGLRIQSRRLGLAGIADVVEFTRAAAAGDLSQLNRGAALDAPLPGVAGRWRPMPVEYKRGRPKKDDCDRVQLCAQALCLEEMLGVHIPAAALYYGQTRRRLNVSLDAALRAETEALAARMHALARAGATPPPEPGPKCANCSLVDLCLPEALRARDRAGRYLAKVLEKLNEPEA